MDTEETVMNSELVTAQELETRGVMKKSTAYRMAKAGKFAHYRVGVAGGGVRFNLREVLESLRRPAAAEDASKATISL